MTECSGRSLLVSHEYSSMIVTSLQQLSRKRTFIFDGHWMYPRTGQEGLDHLLVITEVVIFASIFLLFLLGEELRAFLPTGLMSKDTHLYK